MVGRPVRFVAAFALLALVPPGAARALDPPPVLGEAWSAYADAYYTSRIAGSGVAHDAVLDKLVAAARAGYEANRGPLDDVYRAEAERARQKVDHTMWDAEWSAARARLDALRG